MTTDERLAKYEEGVGHMRTARAAELEIDRNRIRIAEIKKEQPIAGIINNIKVQKIIAREAEIAAAKSFREAETGEREPEQKELLGGER